MERACASVQRFLAECSAGRSTDAYAGWYERER